MSFKETFLKPIFSRNSPSRASELDDFSMGAGERADSFSEARKSAEFESPVSSPVSAQLAADDQPGSGGSKNRVWQSVFNPGRNYHPQMRAVGNSYYDNVDDKAHNASVWEHILKANRTKITFDQLDKDGDGFISGPDLKKALGGSEDINALLHAADVNGDGRIDRNEFHNLLKNSIVAE